MNQDELNGRFIIMASKGETRRPIVRPSASDMHEVLSHTPHLLRQSLCVA